MNLLTAEQRHVQELGDERPPGDLHKSHVDPRTDPFDALYAPEIHGDKNHPLYDEVYAAYRNGAIQNLPWGTLPA